MFTPTYRTKHRDIFEKKILFSALVKPQVRDRRYKMYENEEKHGMVVRKETCAQIIIKM